MAADEIKKQLILLGAEYLADRLIEISILDEGLAKELEMLVLKNDPNKLAKKIIQQINGIKRGTRFIPWNQTHEITDRLYQLMRVIENDLLPCSPELAVGAIEKLFAIEEKIYERADDSHGEIGTFYYSLTEVWGKAWEQYPDRDIDLLPKRLLKILKNNQYLSTEKIIQHSAKALGKEGLSILEKLVNADKEFRDYTLKHINCEIADAEGDVDKYIVLIEKYDDLNEHSVCDIAERLIKQWRGTGAINYLLNQVGTLSLPDKPLLFDPAKVTSSRRFDLLIEAYDCETMIDEAQELRWVLFKLTLSPKYYEGLIKHQDEKSIVKIKNTAIKLSHKKDKGNIRSALNFLSEIQAYEEIDQLVQQNFSVLDDSDYYLFRPLSKNLSIAGYSLSACLLRRKLINGILDRAISKYYKYAVSDLNQAAKYAESVTSWHEFEDHQSYLVSLNDKHKRKSAFWSKVTNEVESVS